MIKKDYIAKQSGVTKNNYGYYELIEKPSQAELQKYYSQKYYQQSLSTYQKTYTNEEKLFFNNKIAQKLLIIEEILNSSLPNRKFSTLLDIGCGEGWAIKYFKENSWEVVGIDYSSSGCEYHNPDCLNNLLIGDIPEVLKGLVNSSEKYSCIWLDNVLEHVLDPSELLITCSSLLETGGVLMIEVPNDFSILQECLMDNGDILNPFWVVKPDHISYFNKDGLQALCEHFGFKKRTFLTDFPIDFNLFNPLTNYVSTKEVGKPCHKTRVRIENLLHKISPVQTNKLYESLAEMGLGRSIIGFFTKK